MLGVPMVLLLVVGRTFTATSTSSCAVCSVRPTAATCGSVNVTRGARGETREEERGDQLVYRSRDPDRADGEGDAVQRWGGGIADRPEDRAGTSRAEPVPAGDDPGREDDRCHTAAYAYGWRNTSPAD